MKKVAKRILMVVVLLIVILVVSYTIWDNNRITIIKQDIALKDLPPQLENFSILQITDLHEKQFGKNQERLLQKINSTDYDVLVFTGDMLNNEQGKNYKPFYSLLEGIDNKENAFFVRGNADPLSYKLTPTIEKSAFVKGVEERGVTFLESMDTLEIDGATIHFVNFELAIINGPENIGRINGIVQPAYVTDEIYKAYQKERWNNMDMDMFSGSDIVIALNHYPVIDARIDYIQNDPNTEWRDFDLVIAGHYHGGQIRLPFIGALFVPEPWHEPSRFFPPQDRVKGLWEYNGTKQYVSAGLGSSEAIPLLKFRLFNTPEINLLKLESQ